MMQVEVLRPADAADMAHLHLAAFPPGQAWTEAMMVETLTLPTTFARSVVVDAALGGFIIVQFIDQDAEILTLATAPRLRRRGVARKLFSALQDELLSLGLKRWLLDVAADNTAALAFYRQLGFQADGRRRNYYQRLEGARVDAILMSNSVTGQSTD